MKNVILAFIGILITLYTFSSVFSVFSLQSRKNELENHVARIVEGFLENAYPNGDEGMLKQRMISELSKNVDDSGKLTVEMQALDLQKGIISVKVSETFRQFNGKERTIVCEKTAIVEQEVSTDAMVTVTFLVDGMLYKEYQVVAGEVCPVPRLPEGEYLGWAEREGADGNLLTALTQVWEDKIYEAITD